MPSVEPAEKERFVSYVSMQGAEIAAHYDLDYDGDANPWTDDGTFYDLSKWESEGYAKALKITRWPGDGNESGTYDRYVMVTIGYYYRPVGKAYDELRQQVKNNFNTNQTDDPNLQFIVIHSMQCMEEIETAIKYDPTRWKRWRFWRSIEKHLKTLKG